MDPVRVLTAQCGGGAVEASDPSAVLLAKANDIRRRVHRVNKITARLRDLSSAAAVRLKQKKCGGMGNAYDDNDNDDDDMMQSDLFCAFKVEFAAALEVLRSLHFFASLTAEERVKMSVTRAAFIDSRRGMLATQRNHQALLFRQLSTAWQHHYRLCKAVERRGEDTQGLFEDNPSSLESDEKDTASSLRKVTSGFILSTPAHSSEPEKMDVRKIQDHMNALHVLFWDLQRVGVAQRELLQRLERDARSQALDRLKNAMCPNQTKEHKKKIKCSSGCCTII